MLRVEKTTPNRDDSRVLLIGAIVAVLLMTVTPLIEKGWDKYLTSRPFVVAETLQIVPVEGEIKPGILYDADARLAVDSSWIATVELPDDTANGPLALRHGMGSYSVKEDGPKLWSWDTWMDDGLIAIPDVPEIPFKVCVRYVSVSKKSGIQDESPKYCSKVYDPVLKKEISE